jgi:hypothetical protein
MGQSVIFIPHLTPANFEWTLFNVRYGITAVPFAAIFFGYMFNKAKTNGKWLLIAVVAIQIFLFSVGYSQILTLRDGIVGLSHAKKPDAEYWMAKHYDNGIVLLDDYARTMSIVRSGIPMQNVIYLGNKPYYENTLRAPEKNVKWIVMQKDDAIWKALYTNPVQQGRVFKYFEKAYTSPEILIFKRNPNVKVK